MKTERIIVSLTTWAPRIKNIPTVLDSIFNQTLLPDLVVINFSEGEIIPKEIQIYLDEHHVECNFVPDTKVYKKLIPTLKKYPNDCVISIDDDWIYPAGMIEDFMDIHKRYPNNPISGNKIIFNGLQCHCGCASLTKYNYFERFIEYIDSDLMKKCLSDDIVYTFFATKAGFPYLRTKQEYFINMTAVNPSCSYSDSHADAIMQTMNYLENAHGKIENPINLYIQDNHISDILSSIYLSIVHDKNIIYKELEQIRKSHAYRLGKFILRPFAWLKRKLT